MDEDGELHAVVALPAAADEVVVAGVLELEREAVSPAPVHDRILSRATIEGCRVNLDNVVHPFLIIEH